MDDQSNMADGGNVDNFQVFHIPTPLHIEKF